MIEILYLDGSLGIIPTSHLMEANCRGSYRFGVNWLLSSAH